MPRSVGRNVRRKDADAKVTGAARYLDDLSFPGMLYGRTVRSTIPRGTLNAIRLDFDKAGFTVVDYRDIPGKNVVALIDDDQPCLAEHEVYHVAEPILLLAHADRERLAAAAVQIDYTPQPALFDPERSTRVIQDASRLPRDRSIAGSPARKSSSKASTGPGIRSSSTSSRTA